jgi:hypothetical protein
VGQHDATTGRNPGHVGKKEAGELNTGKSGEGPHYQHDRQRAAMRYAIQHGGGTDEGETAAFKTAYGSKK